jgi:Tfp pilus assembly protein PilX
MPAARRRRPFVMRGRAGQRGIVVFVALIAVVILSLAAVGLMRSVHTNTIVVGNLAFRQAAQSMSSAAVEKAIYDMFPPTKTIADMKSHDLPRNYFATVQAGQDQYGVPAALQGGSLTSLPPLYPAGAQVIRDKDVSGNDVHVATYVIERMCDDDALGKDPTGIDCEMIPPKQSNAKENQLKKGIPLPRIPYYRMTVRVDGPGNSVAFSQAMLR